MPLRGAVDEPWFPEAELLERLTFGELPGVAMAARSQRAELLRAYTLVYLEEELRREALVKNWPAFARFLQLAAAEAGQMINYAGISREAGVSLPTVKTYYQLLEDMFIGFRVTAFSGSPRKSLLSTERFYFFDIGVRNAAAELPLETAAVRAKPGPVLEQWVGIELWKRLQKHGLGKLHYLRTKAGAEVDFIIARGNHLTPIEVKWTERPTLADARHLLTFLREHAKRARHGYLICRCRAALAESVQARKLASWQWWVKTVAFLPLQAQNRARSRRAAFPRTGGKETASDVPPSRLPATWLRVKECSHAHPANASRLSGRPQLLLVPVLRCRSPGQRQGPGHRPSLLQPGRGR
jgi:predicted AAA+ superfamily ATPase